MKSFVNRDMLTLALGGVAGFYGAKKFRDFTAGYVVPSNASPQVEGAINAGLKIVAAGIGGMVLNKIGQRKLAQGFAIGALTSALFDGWALVTGSPLSLNEYVAPRSIVRAISARRGLSCKMGAYTGFRNIPGARLSAFPRAYGSAF